MEARMQKRESTMRSGMKRATSRLSRIKRNGGGGQTQGLATIWWLNNP
jgi:hypothetical protein